MAASPHSSQSWGLDPSEISNFPLHCKPCPSCPPTPKPKKGTQGPSTRHWGAHGEGSRKHCHLLPPRLAPKILGKLCNSPNLPQHTVTPAGLKRIHGGDFLLVKTLGQDACGGHSSWEKTPSSPSPESPPSYCRHPGPAQTALAMLHLTGKEGAEGPRGDVHRVSHRFLPAATCLHVYLSG